MSTTRNTDAVANQAPGGGSGEFKPRIERDEPMMTGGHAPGKLVGKENIAEFEAQTLPPGTAPAANTFQPNPAPEDQATPNTAPNASDTIAGSTTADMHAGLGKPMQGQTSAEIRHDGEKGRNQPGKGLEGVGATVAGFKTADEHDPDKKHLRALDKDEAVVGRGTVGGPAAEEREPATAETVAVEHGGKSKQDRGT